MYNKKTGGPAFPQQDDATGSEGMTLRDYFAAKAIPVMWMAYDEGYCGDGEFNSDTLAKGAYQIADAMLKAREA